MKDELGGRVESSTQNSVLCAHLLTEDPDCLAAAPPVKSIGYRHLLWTLFVELLRKDVMCLQTVFISWHPQP